MSICSLGSKVGVKFLGCMVTPCLTFWGTVNCFPKQMHQFIFPPAMYESLNISTSLPTSCLFVFLIVAILMDGKWYLILVLIRISLITNDDEHIFMCLLAICIFSFEKCLFQFSAWFSTKLFGYCWDVNIIFKICSRYSSLIRYVICKYFLPFCGRWKAFSLSLLSMMFSDCFSTELLVMCVCVCVCVCVCSKRDCLNSFVMI